MASATTVESELERRVVRKVTLRLIPFLIVTYLINYLDRTNIGFAKLTMSADLGLTETVYGLAAGLFFIGYVLLEVPSNLALNKFGARKWIARIMVSWGIVATLFAFIQTPEQLIWLRVLLGLAEAGFFPGVVLYLTFWYPQRHRGKAMAFLILANPLAAVIGAPISTAILQYLDGVIFGISGWRMLFILEGFPAILLGIMCWFYLTDRPSEAKWLNAQERDWLSAEITREETDKTEKFHGSVLKVLLNGRVLLLGLVYFCLSYGMYSLNFFLPSIVTGLQQQFGVKFSFMDVGLITAIPYGVAAVAMVLWSRHADRTEERIWHVVLPMIVGGVTIPVALYMSNVFLVLAAVTVTCVGIMCTLPNFWSLPTAFLAGPAGAAAVGLINSMGAFSGFSAPYVTGWLNDGTGSSKAGLWVVGSMMVVGGLVVVYLKSRPAPRLQASSDGTPEPPMADSSPR